MYYSRLYYAFHVNVIAFSAVQAHNIFIGVDWEMVKNDQNPPIDSDPVFIRKGHFLSPTMQFGLRKNPTNPVDTDFLNGKLKFFLNILFNILIK